MSTNASHRRFTIQGGSLREDPNGEWVSWETIKDVRRNMDNIRQRAVRAAEKKGFDAGVAFATKRAA